MCPYTCPLLQQTHTFTNGLGSTRKRGTLQDHAYQTTRVYPNEVENHVMNLSLSKDVKTYWEQLKDVILNVGYPHFRAHVSRQRMLNFPYNACFDEW